MAILLLKRIGDVPNCVREENAPSRSLVPSVVLPQADVDSAVLPLLGYGA